MRLSKPRSHPDILDRRPSSRQPPGPAPPWAPWAPNHAGTLEQLTSFGNGILLVAGSSDEFAPRCLQELGGAFTGGSFGGGGTQEFRKL